jgi:hypothetical protein
MSESDIRLHRAIQLWMAWCGPVFTVLLFGGWGLMGGMIPLIGADTSPADIAAAYGDHPTLQKIGLLLGLVGCFIVVPYFIVISLQMRRQESGRVPVLSILQICSGLVICVVLTIPMLLFIATAFRPERSAEVTRTLNDINYILLILPWPPIIGQLVAIAVATWTQRTQVFPRWVGWYSIWVAFLLLPASMIIFFRRGVFAWTGLIGFWIPAAVFGTWYLVMTWVLIRAINDEADAARRSATT